MIERNPPKGKPRARQPRAGSIVPYLSSQQDSTEQHHTHTHYYDGPRELNLHHQLHGISA